MTRTILALTLAALLTACAGAPLAPTDPAFKHYNGLRGFGCTQMNRCKVETSPRALEDAQAAARAAAPAPSPADRAR